MSLILALLYIPAAQYMRGGLWRIMAPVTVLALLIDIVANYTELALITWDWPRAHEWTFSTRLKRLQHDTGWRGKIARLVAAYLNYFDPTGKHV